MKIYSDFPLARLGQIAADLVAVALIALFVFLGVTVHAAILVLAEIGRQVEQAGTGFRSTMTDAANTLGGIPLIGDPARAPFDSASVAGKTLADAGASEQVIVAQIAVIVGIVVAVIPIFFVGKYWLVRRLRFARRATAAMSLSRATGGVDLLALRALASRDTKSLLEIDDDPVSAWRMGEKETMRRLASLELREAGVRIRSSDRAPKIAAA
ncbi:MAG: conserved rane protein [Glaciihabitans sp.]|nr:conserved rane protein [Glaciihabitans sp.]